MDVQMPEMGGPRGDEAIREHERRTGGHLPIVALTAHAMAGDRERCLAAGMDAYVSKPLRPQELYAAVDRYGGPGDKPPAGGGAAPARKPRRAAIDAAPAPGADETGDPASPPAIDRAALLDAFGGKATLLADAIGVFLADVPKMMKRLRKAARAGDLPEIAAAAHAIKGSAGLFSLGAAFESTRRLEHMAASGEREGLETTLAGVEAAMTALARELRRIE